MVASDQMVTAFATALFPTLAVLIGILVNNSRLNDFSQRLNDFARASDTRFADTNRRIEDMRDVLRAEIESVRGGMLRMEQVFDARLKHLEEYLQR